MKNILISWFYVFSEIRLVPLSISFLMVGWYKSYYLIHIFHCLRNILTFNEIQKAVFRVAKDGLLACG